MTPVNQCTRVNQGSGGKLPHVRSTKLTFRRSLARPGSALHLRFRAERQPFVRSAVRTPSPRLARVPNPLSPSASYPLRGAGALVLMRMVFLVAVTAVVVVLVI